MEDSSPYQAPGSAPPAPASSAAPPVRLPAEISRPITAMWVVALILAAISLAGLVYAVMQLLKPAGIAPPPLSAALMGGGLLFDLGLYLGTAWGLRKRSRAAACLLLAYYLFGQVLTFVTGQRAPTTGLFMTIIVTFVMIRGTMETFTAHRYIARARDLPPRLRLSDDPAFAARPAPTE